MSAVAASLCTWYVTVREEGENRWGGKFKIYTATFHNSLQDGTMSSCCHIRYPVLQLLSLLGTLIISYKSLIRRNLAVTIEIRIDIRIYIQSIALILSEKILFHLTLTWNRHSFPAGHLQLSNSSCTLSRSAPASSCWCCCTCTCCWCCCTCGCSAAGRCVRGSA